MQKTRKGLQKKYGPITKKRILFTILTAILGITIQHKDQGTGHVMDVYNYRFDPGNKFFPFDLKSTHPINAIYKKKILSFLLKSDAQRD